MCKIKDNCLSSFCNLLSRIARFANHLKDYQISKTETESERTIRVYPQKLGKPERLQFTVNRWLGGCFSSVSSAPPTRLRDVTWRRWRHTTGARWLALVTAGWARRHHLIIPCHDGEHTDRRRLVERQYTSRRTACNQVQSRQRADQHRSLFQSK